MILKKISWFFKRHPFLYIARFKLLSKNSSIEDIQNYSYNRVNRKTDIPAYYKTVNSQIFEDCDFNSDLELIKHLSRWLQNHIKGGRGLSESSTEALKIMLSGEGGVCSDMAQVFNNFCVLNNIEVREWGNTRAPFDKSYGGHSFNEVFVKELNKWVLIDVSNGILFYNGKDEPLSVVELYQLNRKNHPISYKSFNHEKETNKKNIKKNYLNPENVPFLICNYSNKTYDYYLNRTPPRTPIFVVHFMLYLLGKSYHYRFPLDDYRKIF
ncbi:MAG: transglutaminase domain-containing protein [Algicola sp.]|nr:transglutaminase domain-containing protein [Algicola sp.]